MSKKDENKVKEAPKPKFVPLSLPKNLGKQSFEVLKQVYLEYNKLLKVCNSFYKAHDEIQQYINEDIFDAVEFDVLERKLDRASKVLVKLAKSQKVPISQLEDLFKPVLDGEIEYDSIVKIDEKLAVERKKVSKVVENADNDRSKIDKALRVLKEQADHINDPTRHIGFLSVK